MAIKVLYTSGVSDGLSNLRAGDFTSSNARVAGWDNSLITSSTPDGALSGHVACVTADDEVGVCRDADIAANQGIRILGMFKLNVATDPFENQPALGSGKLAFVTGDSTIALDLYETHDDATNSAQTYAAGDRLYVSKNGMLTKVAADALTNFTTNVGVVRKAAAAGSTTITVQVKF